MTTREKIGQVNLNSALSVKRRVDKKRKKQLRVIYRYLTKEEEKKNPILYRKFEL